MKTKYSLVIIGYCIFVILISVLAIFAANSYAGALDETRCCIIPARTENGDILRRADVLRAFKKYHPCPATRLNSGACPNWAIDHVIPLICGGKDEVQNLQWLPLPIKSVTGTYAKDRFERKIYCQPLEIVQ